MHIFESILTPLNLMQPQPLNIIHLLGLSLLLGAWLSIIFVKHFAQQNSMPNWLTRLYVKALNSSQPYPSTITTYRKEYEYV